MSDSQVCRRPGFREGAQIALADGQLWTIPAPPDPAFASEPPFGSEYRGLLHAIRESEDVAEASRAELALIIFLLRLNHDLKSDQLRSILTFRPDTPQSLAARHAFHVVAAEHLRNAPCPQVVDTRHPIPVSEIGGSPLRGMITTLRGLRLSRLTSLFNSRTY